MANQAVKVAVTGAAGQIGYSLLFRLASGAVFGPDTKVDLNLIEIEPALPALEGVVMELNDCGFPTLGKVTCTADLHEGMDGINWALLVGAAPRKQGMERSDLLKINGGIFTKQGNAINDRAADDVRVVVVGNPCNTNAYIAMSNAPDVPNDRFYAMTMLDELRAKYQLANKAGVDITEVKNLTIWGNHSATQYPDFFNATIQGKAVPEVISDHAWLESEFLSTVQQRGAEIIKARGASSAASAANAALATVKQLITETPEDDCYSVCCYSQGHYGIDEGLIFSFPSRTVNGKHEVIKNFEQPEFSLEKISVTLDELRNERDTVKSLGLIP